VGLTSTVLNIELLLSLGLIYILFQLKNLLIVFIRLLSILILGFLEILIQLLYLMVKIFFIISKAVEFTLSLETSANIVFELHKR
jgi:hypothetical protein